MAGWFLFSALLSLYNKYVFGNTHLNFPCPLLMTSVHFLAQWAFSYTVTSIFPGTFGGDQIASMPWKQFLSIAVPCGFITSADVGFSNLALVRITLTFYTMIKSSSPIFVVLSAYLFGIEQITLPLILVVLSICMGELLAVLGEGVQFDTIGFILCLISSVLAGMRWTIVQLKIQSIEPKLKSGIATMRILSPFMFTSMLGMSLIKERPWTTLGTWIDSPSSAMYMCGLSLLGACLAISMMLCEFHLIMKTNAIILMIGGVLKELNTIFFSVVVFGDTINAVNALGCAVVFAGVILYKISLHVRNLEKKYDTMITTADTSSDNYYISDEEDTSPSRKAASRSSEELQRYINDDKYKSLNKKDDTVGYTDAVGSNHNKASAIDDEDDNIAQHATMPDVELI